MLPSTYNNKLDIITSLYNKYVKLFGSEQMQFVTIQPTEAIYSVGEAVNYISQLLPGQPPYVLVLENNSSLTHHFGYRDCNMEQELHIHLYIEKAALIELQDVIYYYDKPHLKEIKKELGINNLHITATNKRDENIHNYLSKQSDNTLTAYKINFPYNYQLRKTPEQKKSLFTKIFKETKKMREKINVYSLVQLLYCSTTYADIQRSRRENALQLLKQMRIHTQRAKINLLLEEWFTKQKREVPHHYNAPYLPNAPDVKVH